jgi:hypothetical protein
VRFITRAAIRAEFQLTTRDDAGVDPAIVVRVSALHQSNEIGIAQAATRHDIDCGTAVDWFRDLEHERAGAQRRSDKREFLPRREIAHIEIGAEAQGIEAAPDIVRQRAHARKVDQRHKPRA